MAIFREDVVQTRAAARIRKRIFEFVNYIGGLEISGKIFVNKISKLIEQTQVLLDPTKVVEKFQRIQTFKK